MKEIGRGGVLVKLKLFSMGKDGEGMFNAQAWVPGQEGKTCNQDYHDPVEALKVVERQAKEKWPERFEEKLEEK